MTSTHNGKLAAGAYDPLATRGDVTPARPAASVWLNAGKLAGAALLGALYLRFERHIFAALDRFEPRGEPPAGDVPAQDRYRLLVDHTRDIIFFVDAHDRITEANGAAARAYGYAAGDLVGLDARELQARETREAGTTAFARARNAETVVVETKHRRKNGAPFPVEMTLTASPRGGPAAEVLAIVRDTTDRQDADESLAAAYDSAVKASQLKSDFVSAMGHEIRTPMNTIMGMSELMLDTELTDEQRGFSVAVRQSGVALLGIIDDILDYSQMESGGPQFELRDVDVAATVESVVASFASRAAAAGLPLTTRIDAKLDGRVRADEARLRQVLIRLIDNALKFTEHGGVVVSVSVEERDRWSTTLRFAVEDSGPGIADALAALIFEPFQQADRSPTRRHAGTGLGLPIARRLVEFMGGSLCLESVPGEGSTFWFSARFDLAGAMVPANEPSIAGARALIVDDDPMAREIMEHYALTWGLESSVAASGSEALQLLREAAAAGRPYEVAIVDYSMPGGMGGLELGMRSKGEPALAGTQLILVTAYKDLQQRQAVSAAGFTSFLAKPVDRTQLFECVGKAIRRAREAGAVRQGPGPSDTTPAEKRILLVEDHPINQQLGVRQIKKLGFDAVAVGNGEQALAALSAGHYDLVFMDCQMPTMDGFAATRAIRINEQRTGKHVIVVAMTANALAEDRRECLAAGMDDYLAKPVQLEDLQRMIQRYIWDAALAVRT